MALTINITNADFNVDNGTLFVDESTNRVGIGTTTPGSAIGSTLPTELMEDGLIDPLEVTSGYQQKHSPY